MFLVLTSPSIDHCTKVYSVEIDIICLTCPPSLRDDVGPKSLPISDMRDGATSLIMREQISLKKEWILGKEDSQ